MDLGCLSQAHVGAVILENFGYCFHLAHVHHFRHEPSGKNQVAFAILRQLHARKHHASAGVHVLLDGNQPIDRRLHLHVVDIALRLLHSQQRRAPLFFQQRDCRRVRGCARIHILLQLRQPPLGLVQVEQVLSPVNLAYQLVAAHLQLRPAHVKLRFQQRNFVLGLLHLGIGFCFGDLLFGFGQL